MKKTTGNLISSPASKFDSAVDLISVTRLRFPTAFRQCPRHVSDSLHIWYHQIHINIDYRCSMQSLTDLAALVEKYIAAISSLNLDGDDLEEYSTILLQLQNQVETGEPSEAIVRYCLAYLEQFESRAA